MPIYLILPYHILGLLFKILIRMNILEYKEGTKYYEHFAGTGYYHYGSFMIWIMSWKEEDPSGYWCLVFGVNGIVICLIGLLFSLLMKGF